MTIRDAKNFGQTELEKLSPSPALDVNCILEHILNCDKTFLLLHANDSLSPKQQSDFLATIEKRKTGLPIAYITNHKEFYGYDFYLTPDVLIPKPDTEILVENAVNAILEKINSNSDNEHVLKICDMCTGSGCIGISVFLSLSEKLPVNKLPVITFVDISEKALGIAKKNMEKLISKKSFTTSDKSLNGESTSTIRNKFSKGTNFHFILSNLFENVTGDFDFILTNPPYIPSQMVDELLLDGRNEPRLALDGDFTITQEMKNVTTAKRDSIPITKTMSAEKSKSDGLGIIRKLIPQMKNHLKKGGMFFMETGEYNAEAAARICKENGFYEVEIIRDLEGQLRVVCGKK